MIITKNYTSDMIDFTTFNNTSFPVVNEATQNKNVNSDIWYTQYTYNVTIAGVYFVWFSQRMIDGSNGYDFSVRIANNGTGVHAVTSGGSSWVNYVAPSVNAVIRVQAGDVITCQSKGGGSGSKTTAGGRVSIARLY